MTARAAGQREASTPHGIIVRKIPFAFDEGIEPIWNPAQPEWSHMVNGASLTMPYLEPFLIRTMREAMALVDDPGLKEDARGFIGQEGQHFQNHRRYNEMLKAKGYPELAEVEDEMEADYIRFQKKSLRWRLAYTAGFETMTVGLTEWLIGNRRQFFADADPSVTSLVLWHMVEETEHKTAAFDLYQAAFGDYWPRVWGVVCGSLHVIKFSRKAYVLMLERDGRWRNWHSRLRVWRRAADMLWSVGKVLVGSMLPGHHPSRVSDPAWVRQWADAYAGLPENHIPLLDTRDPEIPARFA